MTGRNVLRRSVPSRSLALLFVMCAGLTSSLLAGESKKAKARIDKSAFGKLEDGTPIEIYTLKNRNGLQVDITTYGGAVVTIKTPDRHGRMADIVLGYADASGYVADTSYFGALIGRYANRIARGRFTLNGVEYQLAQNNGVNHLHGGVRGFHKVVWQAREVNAHRRRCPGAHLSQQGQRGRVSRQPGCDRDLHPVQRDELRIEYTATTDKETVVNLTHHSYFNLAGAGAGDILGHELKINADRFTPVDETLIPTGELKAVKGTPFDFNRATAIGSRINQADDQLVLGKGYDHNFVLNKQAQELSCAATVYEPTSGRGLEMWTTEPGVQLYPEIFSTRFAARRARFTTAVVGFV